MKLPSWQASVNTTMPRKSPSLLGAPAMRKAAVMNFVALDNPNDYLQLGRAKAAKYTAIGNTVNDAIGLYASITEADQVARANAEVAKHAEAMASWTIENERQPFYIENEDGTRTYGWEDSVEGYNTTTSEYKAKILESTNFTNKKAIQVLEKGFSVNDRTYRSKVQKFVQDRKVDRGRASIEEEVSKYIQTGNIGGIDAAYQRGVQAGLFGQEEAFDAQQQALKTLNATQISIGISTLRSISDTASDDTFNTVWYAAAGQLQDPTVKLNPSERRAMMSQLAAVKNDFEDRIKTARTDVNYAQYMQSLSAALLSGDTEAINKMFTGLETAGAREIYGKHYFDVIKAKHAFMRGGGETTPSARIGAARQIEGVRDLSIPPLDALQYLLGKVENHEMSAVDGATYIGQLGVAADKEMATQYSDAKRTVYMQLLQVPDPEWITKYEERQGKQDAIQQANIILLQLRQEQMAAKQQGRIIPDLPGRALELIVESTFMEEYWRNAAGQPAKDVWDIDRAKSQEYIDGLYDADVATGANRTMSKKDRSDRVNSLRGALRLKQSVRPPETRKETSGGF